MVEPTEDLSNDKGQGRPAFNDTSFRVRYAETDQMGMTHHSSYIPWLEVGRTEYMRERGFPYTWLEAKGLALPVVECYCRYIRPTRYDDLVTVRSFLRQLTRTRMAFEYEVLVETGEGLEKAAEGRTLHFFVNREGRPIHLGLSSEVWQAMETLAKEVNNAPVEGA